MQAVFTPDELTPFSFEEAAEAMEAALADQLKAKPSREVLALALAKTALETGRWKKIHCFNWGNIKAGEHYAGMFTCFLLNEVLGGKVVWFAPEGQLIAGPGSAITGQHYAVPDGHPQTRMRAYANRFDGAYSYVDFVSGSRYAGAWKLLLKGDAAGYVHALKLAGYFTADEATYAKGVISLQKEFIGKLADLPHHEIEHANVPDEVFTAAQTAHNLMVLERALDDMAVLVDDEKYRALRDASLTDEERKRLGYDTDPHELGPESEKQA
jgi:hypothetical protein